MQLPSSLVFKPVHVRRSWILFVKIAFFKGVLSERTLTISGALQFEALCREMSSSHLGIFSYDRATPYLQGFLGVASPPHWKPADKS